MIIFLVAVAKFVQVSIIWKDRSIQTIPQKFEFLGFSNNYKKSPQLTPIKKGELEISTP